MADPFSSADAFMNSGSNVSVKFPKVGAEFDGDIVGWDGPVQMTDMDSGEALYWVGGAKVKESEVKNMSVASPAMQLLVHLQGEATGITYETNQYIEKELPDDDGLRTLYVHGELQKALKKARTAAGNAVFEVGAHVHLVRTKPVKKGNGFWAYTFDAVWTPASANPSFANKAFDDSGDPPFEADNDSDEPPF